MSRSYVPERQYVHRPRRRTPKMLMILAAIGLMTVIVLALRYVIIPLLVMLEGIV